MKSVDRGKSNSPRILYLRTFKDATFDHTLIISLAMILADQGRLVVLGSRDDRIALQAQWHKRFRDNPPLSDHVEYRQTSDSEWRQHVHQEISKADCILLFIEAKGRRFPKLSVLKLRKLGVGDFFMGPLLKQSTGAGLLHEVVYLERLKKVRRTIVLCRARNVAHIVELIRQACLFSASNGLLLDTRRIRQGGARNLLPHFSTLDMQVGILHEAAGIVTFRNNELKNPHSKFSLKLKSSVEGVYSKPRTGRGMGLNATARLLGQSNKPRRLPPDGEKKIIQFTNVEDLVRIPARELTEVSSDEVSELLSAEGLSQGCPYCKQPLAGIFFYVRGLHRRPGDEHEDIKGRCQHCYCSTGIDEGMLRDI